MSVDLGDHVRIFTQVLDEDGDAVQATGASPAVKVTVTDPAGTETSYDDTGAVTYDAATLTYSVVVDADTVPGVWRYVWESFGTYQGVNPGVFLVDDHDSAAASVWTVQGYQAMRGVTLTDAELDQIDLQIRAAAAWVQRRTEQQLVYVEDDEQTFDGMGTRAMFLPQLPVTDVSAVSEVRDGVTTALVLGTDWDWSARRGAIYRLGCRWPRGQRNVIVTYSHGYAEMPLDIQRLVYGLAARGVGSPDGQGVTQEQIGQYSATYEGMNGGVTAWESAILDRIRDQNGVAA